MKALPAGACSPRSIFLLIAFSLFSSANVKANDPCQNLISTIICAGDQASGQQFRGSYWEDNDPPVYTGPSYIYLFNLTTDINPASGQEGISLFTGRQTGEIGGLLYDDGENGSYSPISQISYTGGVTGINTSGSSAPGIAISNTGGNGGAGLPGAVDDSDGGDGGAGGVVVLESLSGFINTDGNYSHGLYGFSSGGNGGSGSIASIFGEGGNSGSGGAGGLVRIDLAGGSVTTLQNSSSGIYASSIGGSAGDVGNCIGICVGKADVGSAQGGGLVLVTAASQSSIYTEGVGSYGIFAQSRGGGGGDGGFGTFLGMATWSSEGGGGGHGGIASVVADGVISTTGNYARGIFAQSIGGGGGDGGYSLSLLASLGGDGGVAGNGGTVQVDNGVSGIGTILTGGLSAQGIFAQSVGGGGGDGGWAAALLSLGGDGGAAGDGGTVTVNNAGIINTVRDKSEAIFAQSVGGGGGNGGFALGQVSLGGKGGAGGAAGAVTINNTSAVLTTSGELSAAILAQSVGGGGGNGGNSVALGLPFLNVASFAIGVGGDGALGGAGGAVTVDSSGLLVTAKSRSPGISAQSIGGGGGDAGFAISASFASIATFSLSIGGKGGAAGNGGEVVVDSTSTIVTQGEYSSPGIYAQSVGGGGGDGGVGFAGGLSAGNLNVSIGGEGNSGGNGGSVTVGQSNRLNSGDITTAGTYSPGIAAVSKGGGGGSGGFSIAAGFSTSGSASFTIGGDGGRGGVGGEVNVFSNRGITTEKDHSAGIYAASGGGRGGTGGFSVAGNLTAGQQLGISIGSGGGFGGVGGNVNVGTDVTNAVTGRIETSGVNSAGIKAVSSGGAGGSAGFSVAGAVSMNGGMDFSLGRSGGSGNRSGNVEVVSAAEIVTSNTNASGIYAQSLAGSGGDGGMSATGGFSYGNTVNLSIGGGGGSSNVAGTVTVGNFGSIETNGDNAKGIHAVSQGGNGGNGGLAVATQLSYAPGYRPDSAGGNVSVVIGRGGGSSGRGELVTVSNFGSITTGGGNSQGVYAQSIGGDGGTGGFAYSGSLAIGGSSNQIGFTLGGSGGSGAWGGAVEVSNFGAIQSSGHGIFAESLGGGGGAGGNSLTAVIQAIDSSGTLPNAPATNEIVTIGGSGGAGNHGGTVRVDNTSFFGAPPGTIETTGNGAHGIYAQSVGGGGGDGGSASGVSLILGNQCGLPGVCKTPLNSGGDYSVKVDVGGEGARGSNGRLVTVNNDGDITTRAAGSNGILAQSVGGGGGNGGNGVNALGIPALDIPLAVAGRLTSRVGYLNDWVVEVGGDGGSSGNGGNVIVENSGNITTHGEVTVLADGQFIQLDAEGGVGILAQSVGGGGGIGIVSAGRGGDAAPGLAGKLGLGGGAGSTGNGGYVEVTTTAGTINTLGIGAHGIWAQSVGGGGGIAGDIYSVSADFTVGLNLGIARAGSAGGIGGQVLVDSAGNIITAGDRAMGIVAQSIGGGGGTGGDPGLLGVISNVFYGSTGGNGASRQVDVSHAGNIDTGGENARGIFAQSVSGSEGDIYSGFSAPVNVTLDGDITVAGRNASGIVAQSMSSVNAGNITVNINSGSVQGGSNQGVGVLILDGQANSLINRGTLSALSGQAIRAGDGHETVDNYGTISGRVRLGGGLNSFRNRAGGILLSGSSIDLGSGNALVNEGRLAPGGAGEIEATWVDGDLELAASGTYQADLLLAYLSKDRLQVSGSATLAGAAEISLIDAVIPAVQPGEYALAIVRANGGVSGSFDSEVLPASTPLLDFSLDYTSNSADLIVSAASYSRVATDEAQTDVAGYLDSINPQTVTPDLMSLMTELQNLPDARASSRALGSLSQESYHALTSAAFFSMSGQASQLSNRMTALRSNQLASRGDSSVFTPIQLAFNGSSAMLGSLVDGRSQPGRHGVWLQPVRKQGDQSGQDGFTGFDYELQGVTLGYDREQGDWVAGVAFGSSDTDLDYDGSQVSGGLDGYYLSAYGSWSQDDVYLDGLLSYGRNSYDQQRQLTVGTIQRSAVSEHDGDVLSAYFATGKVLQAGVLVHGPYASIQYVRIREDGFSETGAGGANLVIRSNSVNGLNSELGWRLLRNYDWGDSNIVTELSAAWAHDFDVDDQIITGSYAGAPGTTFSMEGQDVERNGIVVGLGFSYLGAAGVTAALRYQGEARSGYRADTILGELRYDF